MGFKTVRTPFGNIILTSCISLQCCQLLLKKIKTNFKTKFVSVRMRLFSSLPTLTLTSNNFQGQVCQPLRVDTLTMGKKF